MIITTFFPILLGITLIWISAEKLEKYSVSAATSLGMSPFLIGSTVIAFGTSAPEMLTTFFAALDDKGSMIIGNVIGSNVANLSLVFGTALLILAFKKKDIKQLPSIKNNLLILLAVTFLSWLIIAINPFSVASSLILIFTLILVIIYWYKTNPGAEVDLGSAEEKYMYLKLTLSLGTLIFAAWLITFGATNILEQYQLGELFIGFTVLAVGTSLPEIAAASSLALRGRYETVAGTLIGSNIFNSLTVLAIPGFFNSSLMAESWNYASWSYLLMLLAFVTLCFSMYIFTAINNIRKASKSIALLFLSAYFFSLLFAY